MIRRYENSMSSPLSYSNGALDCAILEQTTAQVSTTDPLPCQMPRSVWRQYQRGRPGGVGDYGKCIGKASIKST